MQPPKTAGFFEGLKNSLKFMLKRKMLKITILQFSSKMFFKTYFSVGGRGHGLPLESLLDDSTVLANT